MPAALSARDVARTVKRTEKVAMKLWDAAGDQLFASPLNVMIAEEYEVRNGKPLIEVCLVFGECSTEIHIYDLADAARHLAERLRVFAGDLTRAGDHRHARMVREAAERVETVV